MNTNIGISVRATFSEGNEHHSYSGDITNTLISMKVRTILEALPEKAISKLSVVLNIGYHLKLVS